MTENKYAVAKLAEVKSLFELPPSHTEKNGEFGKK
jgi:hypothetical protein